MEENWQPFLSILIPTYNRSHLVIRAIQSIDTQRNDVEIIVIDNNSNQEIYRTLEERVKDLPRVKLFRNDENIGMVRNWNHCISLANGQWMGLLCSDDNYLHGAIDYVYNLLKSTEKPSLVIQDPSITEAIKRSSAGRETAKNLKLPLASGNFWHREIVENLGGFDERFKYSPDAEFWYRIANQFPVIKVRGNLVQYNNDGSNYAYTTWKENDFLEQIELLGRQNLKHIHGEDLSEDFIRQELDKGVWSTLMTILGDTVSKKDKQDIYDKYISIAKMKADNSERKNQLANIELYHQNLYPTPERKATSVSQKQSLIPISFIVWVYNEEERIRYILEHATRWADEVIVVNKSSTDKTKDICHEYGERVKVIDIPFSHRGHEDVVAIMKLPINDWIFVGPASEIPTRKLIERCREILSETKGELDLVFVPRKYYSFGIHDKRSPWSISYFPFLINRKKAIITNTIHFNFQPRNPENTRAIEFLDDCCVYHLTHKSAKDYLRDMTDYFEAEAASCTNPDAKIQECFANMARYEKQLRESGESLFGHYLAWPIYWLGTALFVWEKKRGMDVGKFYQNLRDEVLKREWLDYDSKEPIDAPEHLIDQAKQKIQSGDKEGAKSILLDMINRWPKFAPAYQNLATISVESGNIENASKYFDEALKLDKNNREAVHEFGNMLMRKNNYAKAKEIFGNYLNANPNDIEIRAFMQKCESILGKVSKLGFVVGKIK